MILPHDNEGKPLPRNAIYRPGRIYHDWFGGGRQGNREHLVGKFGRIAIAVFEKVRVSNRSPGRDRIPMRPMIMPDDGDTPDRRPWLARPAAKGRPVSTSVGVPTLGCVETGPRTYFIPRGSRQEQ